jgi:hypothetical protein
MSTGRETFPAGLHFQAALRHLRVAGRHMAHVTPAAQPWDRHDVAEVEAGFRALRRLLVHYGRRHLGVGPRRQQRSVRGP